jgi:hypothetical protein
VTAITPLQAVGFRGLEDCRPLDDALDPLRSGRRAMTEVIEINDGVAARGYRREISGSTKMLIYEYLDDKQDRPRQPRIAAEAASIDDSFKRKMFPVRPLPYVLAISLLLLFLFAVNRERFEALVRSPLPAVTADTIEPAARQSLPARAATYRENFIAH